MKKDKTVGIERQIACVECNRETYHKVAKSINLESSGDWGFFWQDYEILVCQGCREVSFRKAVGADDVIGQDDDGNFVYNESEDLFPSRVNGRKELKNHHLLPLSVGRVYRETHRAIMGKQPVLAGMGIRALVEAVCVERKIKGRDLKEKINNLVTAGLLTEGGANLLHQIRSYGNDAAHEALEIKEDELGILMDFAENLLLGTYILSKKVAGLSKNKTIQL